MDITSYFPEEKRKIQYEAILDELLRSKILIDNITKVDFSIALINNILEIYKNINTDNQTFTNIEGSRNNVQTIIKLNKLILLVKNEDPKELLKLIVILGNIYYNISDSLKTLTSNSFYQILLNTSQLAINYTISYKNNHLEEKEYEFDCSLILNTYSFILDYMTKTFGNLFYDNKRVILECILQIDKINDQELKEILANQAVKFAQTYIKIIKKEQIFEKDKQKEVKKEFSLKDDNENNNIIINEENQNENFNNQINNINLAYKSISRESLLNHSLQNLVRTFIKTDVFKIKIEKVSNEDDSDSEEEKERNNIIANQNRKDNNNENKVFGYTIIFDELNKIKGKRVESIIVKLNLIDMYNYIGDKEKINSTFLDIKEDISFLTHRKEYHDKVILVLDKIKWFFAYNKDALKKETINAILKFIDDTYENKKLPDNKKNEIKEKYKEIMNFLNEEEE